MKIAILTHPLGTNYGGILQNYALQRTLKEMGHDPITLHYCFGVSWGVKILSFFSRLLQRIRGKKVPLRIWTTRKEHAEITCNTEAFIRKNIKTTPRFVFEKLKYVLPQDIDAIVVGSDQVWRGKNPDVKRFFLNDFQGFDLKRVAYAASFGVDYWEYTPIDTEECSKLAKMFDAISVRENSGVDLCERFLHVKAQHVLDPTLLINKSEYDLLVSENLERRAEKYFLSYILDQNTSKQIILETVAKELMLSERSVMVEVSFRDVGHKGLSQCIFEPVEEWIRGFKDAEYVITDSFHGTVFSIIYHKPFISIINKGRGADRFISLLSMLNLESRLVENAEEAKKVIHTPIDYATVDIILEKKKRESLDFLNKYLT